MTLQEKVDKAKDPKTDIQTLGDLSKDEDLGVRLNVARNPSASPEILSLLSKDENPSVKQEAMRNKNYIK